MNRRDLLKVIGAGAALVAWPQAAARTSAAGLQAGRSSLGGLSVFAMTPMRMRSGRAEVDMDGFARNMRYYTSLPGRYSVAICGAVGEFHDLTPSERADLVRAAAAAKNGRTLIAGIGGDDTADVVAQAVAMERAGADAVLVLPSAAIGKGGDEALVRHFFAVADAVSAGVVPYRSLATLFSLDTAERLLERPNIVAIKEQTADVRWVRDASRRVNGAVPIIPAHERLAPFMHLAGARGMTSGHVNFAAERSFEIWQQLEEGRTADALALSDKFAHLDVLRATYGDILLKAGLELRGLAGGPMRKGPEALSPEGRRALQDAMRAMDVLEPVATR